MAEDRSPGYWRVSSDHDRAAGHDAALVDVLLFHPAIDEMVLQHAAMTVNAMHFSRGYSEPADTGKRSGSNGQLPCCLSSDPLLALATHSAGLGYPDWLEDGMAADAACHPGNRPNPRQPTRVVAAARDMLAAGDYPEADRLMMRFLVSQLADWFELLPPSWPVLDHPAVPDAVYAAERYLSGLMMVEVTMPDGSKKDVAMKLADFNKLAPNMGEVLRNAHGTRGRLPGTRVGNGS